MPDSTPTTSFKIQAVTFKVQVLDKLSKVVYTEHRKMKRLLEKERKMSWQDQISNAEAGIPRAQVMLTRAQGRGSKALIAEDIEDALQEVGTDVKYWRLLDLYGLRYSAEGLRQCAEYLQRDFANPQALREYFGVA